MTKSAEKPKTAAAFAKTLSENCVRRELPRSKRRRFKKGILSQNWHVQERSPRNKILAENDRRRRTIDSRASFETLARSQGASSHLRRHPQKETAMNAAFTNHRPIVPASFGFTHLSAIALATADSSFSFPL
jgi:hypothetical protein